MKAITVRQPWASLIAAGVKTIETRPRRTSYRGRIAIHAGLKGPVHGSVVREWRVEYPNAPGYIVRTGHGEAWPLPLGAVVASAVLTDCLPIEKQFTEKAGRPGEDVVLVEPGLELVIDRWNAVRAEHVTDQLPFGDFSPGRWALLLDDIAPTTERCPRCWGTGWTEHQTRSLPRYPRRCDCCRATGRCDPVPARGQQTVPWEWTP